MKRISLCLLAVTAPLALLGCSPLLTVGPGTTHTCAISNDHVGKCWGSDRKGQLGDGVAGDARSTPMNVSGLGRGTAITSGAEHSCAILEDRTVACWGDNELGQLGAGSRAASSATPLKVGWPPPNPPVIPPSPERLVDVVSIAAGDAHTCASRNNGDVWCWGNNTSAELGIPQTGGFAISPVLVTLRVAGAGSPAKAIQLAAAGQFTCALTADFTVWCWGLNNRGQLGRGATGDREGPAPVPGLANATAIAAGHDQACAVVRGGAVRCWGQTQAGFSSTRPTTIPGLSNIRSVAAGADHACALSTDGSVRCWGSNSYGQLGVNGPSRSTPMTVVGLTAGSKIAAGHFATCVVTSDSSLLCWGANAHGEIGQPTDIDTIIATPTLVQGL